MIAAGTTKACVTYALILILCMMLFIPINKPKIEKGTVFLGLYDEVFLNTKNNYFDRVLCYSIFHYFPSYNYALEVILEMIRVTKPGGLILLGDILDAHFESEIKGNSDLEYEKTIPLIHRYSQWRFYNFKKLIDDLAAYTTKVEVLTQPETFVLATYRKDIRIWVS